MGKGYVLGPEELETTITYDMGEKVVRIFSAIRRDQRRIEKVGIKPYAGDPGRGLMYKVPLSRLRWRVTSGIPSKRGFASRKLHTNVDISVRKGTPLPYKLENDQ